MAIGLELELLPMLRKFAAVCLRELQINRIDFYLLRDDDGQLTLAGEAADTHLVHTLGMPEDLTGLMNPDMFLVLQRLRQKNTPFYLEKDHQLGAHTCYFQLHDQGLVSIKSLRPFDERMLSELPPLFDRLAQSCRSCIVHERLLHGMQSQRASADIIHFQLYHDELTRLPNRRMLMEQLTKDISRAQRHGHFGAVLFLDLNRFKVINDTFGHATGDALLIKVAEILQSQARREDTVARLSGDEFVFLITHLTETREQAEFAIVHVLQKIHKAFASPIRVKHHMLHVTPSIGVEVYPNGNCTADEILHHADIAMYQAKSKGPNNSSFFDQKNSEEVRTRLELEHELKKAMESMDEFCLYYQPQYNADGQCVGAEALLRWENPRRGLVSPAVFVPIAEETGLMLKLGVWIVQQACRDLAELETRGLPKTFRKLSVNVSAIQFSQRTFIPDLLEITRYYGITRRLLGIELTESLLIKNVEDTVDKIAALRDAGITASIDDFGTGYSSLAYLTRFPIDTLKIDRMFVRDLDTNAGNKAVIDTIMVLGRNLKLGIVAEGVETEAELRCLREFNCMVFQGFYFSKPLPYPEFLLELERNMTLQIETLELPFGDELVQPGTTVQG